MVWATRDAMDTEGVMYPMTEETNIIPLSITEEAISKTINIIGDMTTEEGIMPGKIDHGSRLHKP